MIDCLILCIKESTGNGILAFCNEASSSQGKMSVFILFFLIRLPLLVRIYTIMHLIEIKLEHCIFSKSLIFTSAVVDSGDVDALLRLALLFSSAVFRLQAVFLIHLFLLYLVKKYFDGSGTAFFFYSYFL